MDYERKTKEVLPVLAICYDFDKTLTPDNMQAQGYIQSVGYDVDRFWEETDNLAHENGMDGNLAYMYKMVVDPIVLNELIKQKSWFYISGLVAVLYQGSDREIYKQLVAMTNELQSYPWIRIIHIIYENTYFDWINKSFSDLLDGRYIQAEALKTI